MSFKSTASLFRATLRAQRTSRPARPVTSVGRTYATQSGSSSSSPLLWTALGAVAAGGAYFAYTSSQPGDASTPKNAASTQQVDYQAVYNAVADVIDAGDEEYDDGSYGPVLVRLAWHASGTYDKETGSGGSNGATMRFAPEANHGANAGLNVARDRLEPIKAKFPAITYSDLWTLAGVAAVQEMGGPKIPWRPGRQDGFVENCTPDGRLPDGDKGADHIRHIFYRQGFNDQEIVALSGAHVLGRCHENRSGFSGPWTFSPTTFSNEYFRLLFDEKWQFKKWKGPPQYEDKKTKSLMMLMTDIALTTDKSFRKYAQEYASNEATFFKDFSAAFAKLLENGVPEKNWKSEPILFKTSDEVKA